MKCFYICRLFSTSITAECRTSESIEGLMDDQAFSPSYDLVPPPPLLSGQKIVCLSQSSCVSPVIMLTEKEGGGEVFGGGGAKLYDGEKAWSTMNHSILPAAHLGNITSFPNVFTII